MACPLISPIHALITLLIRMGAYSVSALIKAIFRLLSADSR